MKHTLDDNMSDHQAPAENAKVMGENGELSQSKRRLIMIVSNASLIVTVWLPAALAAIVLLIGLATSDVRFIVTGVVGGILIAFLWVLTKGTRDAAKTK